MTHMSLYSLEAAIFYSWQDRMEPFLFKESFLLLVLHRSLYTSFKLLKFHECSAQNISAHQQFLNVFMKLCASLTYHGFNEVNKTSFVHFTKRWMMHHSKLLYLNSYIFICLSGDVYVEDLFLYSTCWTSTLHHCLERILTFSRPCGNLSKFFTIRKLQQGSLNPWQSSPWFSSYCFKYLS